MCLPGRRGNLRGTDNEGISHGKGDDAHLDDVRYCVEWHDRLWPQDERPPLGFHTRTERGGRV